MGACTCLLACLFATHVHLACSTVSYYNWKDPPISTPPPWVYVLQNKLRSMRMECTQICGLVCVCDHHQENKTKKRVGAAKGDKERHIQMYMWGGNQGRAVGGLHRQERQRRDGVCVNRMRVCYYYQPSPFLRETQTKKKEKKNKTEIFSSLRVME